MPGKSNTQHGKTHVKVSGEFRFYNEDMQESWKSNRSQGGSNLSFPHVFGGNP
ncbi:hypothetical protein JW964_16485 [candidate division KSB1 bacterium]|nr:hypothetical protein [candidate division KSB1 bacterium]